MPYRGSEAEGEFKEGICERILILLYSVRGPLDTCFLNGPLCVFDVFQTASYMELCSDLGFKGPERQSLSSPGDVYTEFMSLTMVDTFHSGMHKGVLYTSSILVAHATSCLPPPIPLRS